jgi:D-alanyl-lipoteichoic acid acyltransferase DltB (MBOAT superfamily)
MPASVPGKTLGIVGLILAFVGPGALLGLILSIIAKVQSNRAGVKNTPATVGIVVSIIIIVLTIILYVTVFATLLSACNGVDPGTYTLDNGGTLTCG